MAAEDAGVWHISCVGSWVVGCEVDEFACFVWMERTERERRRGGCILLL